MKSTVYLMTSALLLGASAATTGHAAPIKGSEAAKPVNAAKPASVASSSVATALQKLGTNGGTLTLTAGQWAVEKSLSIPANVHLTVQPGAKITIAAGQTLTVGGSFESASIAQLFYGKGRIRFLGNYLGEVYPQWWGQIGGKDDTATCQAALESGAARIRFPKATYAIDGVGDGREAGFGLQPLSNTTLLFDTGSVLQAITTDKNDYSIINIIGKENVVVDGATIRGERNTHTAKGGEWGHGIRIRHGSRNITVRNARVSDCWGDGIYLGEICVENVLVENSHFDNNRRNGCSITDAKNVLFRNCSFTNSNGTSPLKGVDVEPNKKSDAIQNIVFENCRSSGNLGCGFSVARDDAQELPVSVTFRNCYSENDGAAFGVDIGPSDGPGILILKDCIVVNPGETGFRLSSANLNTEIDGLYIFNPNQKRDARPQFASGISLWNASPQHEGKKKIAGNFSARNVHVYSSDGKAAYAVYSNNERGAESGFQNVDIELKTDLPSEKRFFKGAGPFFNYFRVNFSDNPVVKATADIAAPQMAAYIGQTITNTGAEKDVTLALTDPMAASLDSVYTFEVDAAHKLTIDLGTPGLLPAGAPKCWSNQPGSRLKLRHDGHRWQILEQSGTWTFGN
jgi:hypothetical protein